MNTNFKSDTVFKVGEYFFSPPVPPIKELEVTETSLNTREETINMGEVNLVGGKGLKTFTWNSFLPANFSWDISGDSVHNLIPNNPYLPSVVTGESTDRTGLVMTNEAFIRLIRKAMDERIPVRITGRAIPTIEGDWYIDNFRPKMRSGDRNIFYTIDFSEAKGADVKVVRLTTKKGSDPIPSPTRPAEQGKFAVGDMVTCQGTYFSDSYGKKPSYSFKQGFLGKVHRVINDSKRPYPIHIANTKGGWIGWVKPSQLTIK